jgi:hypothetical protein
MRADAMNIRNDANDERSGERDEEKNIAPLVPSELDIEEGDEEEKAKEKLPPAMPPGI